MINKSQELLPSSYYWLAILMPISISMGRGVADATLTTAAILFIIHIILKKELHYFKEKWFIAAIILWAYILIRSLFSDIPLMGITKTLPFVRFPLFALCCQYLGLTHKDFSKKLYLSSLLAVIFLTIDGYIQYVFGKDLLGHPIKDEGNFYRLTGPFSKMVLGSTITILSIPTLGQMIDNIAHRSKVMFSGILLIAIYVIVFLSGERAALLQITLAILILIWALIKNKKTLILFSSICTLIAAILVHFFNLDKVISRQIFSIFEILKNYSTTPYGKLWNSGFKIGKENWIFGIGPMNFEKYCTKISDFCSYHPHNIYIEFFAETGLVGLTILLFVFYFFLKRFLDSQKSILITSTFTAFLIKIMPIPSSGFFKNWYAVPLWLMIGWFLASSTKKTTKIVSD